MMDGSHNNFPDQNSSDGNYREAPHNLEAEQAVLGSILTNTDALFKVRDFLKPDHFFNAGHARVYDAILKLVDKNQVVTPVKLKPYFEHDDEFADVGGSQYLVRVAASAATIINTEDYGRSIFDLAMRRVLIQIGEGMVIDAYDAPVDADPIEAMEKVETELHSLHGHTSKKGITVRSTAQVVSDARDMFSQAGENNGVIGLSTGLSSLDKLFSFVPGDFTILGGRPSMGKSALANVLSFAAAAGNENQEPAGVLFFSKEMRAEHNIARQVSSWISHTYQRTVPYFRIIRDQLQDNERQWVEEAYKAVADSNIEWVDASGLTPSRVRMIAKRKKREFERRGLKLGLITVDYIQQLKADERVLNETQEMNIVSSALLDLGQEMDLAMFALSQLNRQVETRDDKRPLLSDLRQTGSLEQDAANVMLLYRHEHYLQKQEPRDAAKRVTWEQDMAKWAGIAEAILAKNRNGPTGTVKLNANMAANHFSDMIQQGDMLDG